MGLSIYHSDDVTLATDLVFGPTDAGATSATQTLHAWNNKGTSGGSLRDLAFVVQVEDPGAPGTFKSSGLTALDEHWLEARINGGTNPGNDAGFLSVTSDWYRLGSGVVLRAPDLPGNCAFYLEVRLHPPLRDGVPTETVNFRLLATYAETATPSGAGLSELGSGFLTGVGDRRVREFVEAPTVTATGTPDAYVHVSRRWYIHDGISLRSCATEDLLLNQTDGAAASLSTGQEYKALISQGPGAGTGDQAVTVTKGVKAATGASVAPALPATHIPVALVTVAYHASASVIGSTAINVLATDGRAKATAGTGLTVSIAKYRALVAGGLIVTGQATTVSLGASVTSWVWLGGSGAFTVTTTAAAPFAGALPVCKVVTGSSTVTSVTDLRSYFEPAARYVRLKYANGEPLFDLQTRRYRYRVAIAASAYSDSVPADTIPAGALVLAVSAKVIVKPGTTSTFDLGVAGATTRHGTGISTTVGTTHGGLVAGPFYYAADTKIRITPNATPSDALGVIEVQVTLIDARTSPGMSSEAFPYAWNLDRVVAHLGSSSSGSGSTEFNPGCTLIGDLCPSGSRPSIAAGALSAEGFPNVTVGAADTFSAYVTGITDPGDSDAAPRNLECALVLYPLTRAS